MHGRNSSYADFRENSRIILEILCCSIEFLIGILEYNWIFIEVSIKLRFLYACERSDTEIWEFLFIHLSFTAILHLDGFLLSFLRQNVIVCKSSSFQSYFWFSNVIGYFHREIPFKHRHDMNIISKQPIQCFIHLRVTRKRGLEFIRTLG